MSIFAFGSMLSDDTELRRGLAAGAGAGCTERGGEGTREAVCGERWGVGGRHARVRLGLCFGVCVDGWARQGLATGGERRQTHLGARLRLHPKVRQDRCVASALCVVDGGEAVRVLQVAIRPLREQQPHDLGVLVLDRRDQRRRATPVLDVDGAAAIEQQRDDRRLALGGEDERRRAVLVRHVGGHALVQQLGDRVYVALAHCVEERRRLGVRLDATAGGTGVGGGRIARATRRGGRRAVAAAAKRLDHVRDHVWRLHAQRLLEHGLERRARLDLSEVGLQTLLRGLNVGALCPRAERLDRCRRVSLLGRVWVRVLQVLEHEGCELVGLVLARALEQRGEHRSQARLLQVLLRRLHGLLRSLGRREVTSKPASR